MTTTTWMTRRVCLGAAAALLLLSGCGASEGTDDAASGGAGEPSASVSTPTVQASEPAERPEVTAPECMPAGATVVGAGTADFPVTVITQGSGPVGVVLLPQNGGDACQWNAEFTRLAADGHHVASFTWSKDAPGSVTGAIGVLTEAGATSIVLVGASKGGAFAAALAQSVDAAAVVAVSPPASFGGQDAVAGAAAYDGPLVVIASPDDNNVSLEESKQVADANPAATFISVAGPGHGVALLDGPDGDVIRDAIDKAITGAS